MKPENFDQLSHEEQEEIALPIFASLRGQYLIAQALQVAIRTMKAKDDEELELSNIEDMEMLLQGVYQDYAGCFKQ